MRSILIILCISIFSLSTQAQTPMDLSISSYTFENNSGEQLEAELGAFTVPQNHEHAQGKRLKLAFVRFSAQTQSHHYPIVYLAGGPGGSGTGAAKGNRFPLFMALRKTADVIAFDQRGTGLSEHLPACETQALIPLHQAGTEETYAQAMSQALETCIQAWAELGYNFQDFNTRQSAADLEALRIALGVEKLNLWGISYGTHLAMAYMKYYPERVDKAVLTGLEGLDQTVKEPKHIDQYFERINQMLEKDAFYSEKIKDLPQLMQEVFTSLETKPQLVETFNPQSKEKITVGIGKLDLQLFTSFFLTKNPEQLQNLPLLFLSMQAGDYSHIAPYIAMLKIYARKIEGMPLAMDFMSGISEAKQKEISQQAKSALLGKAHNFPFPTMWSYLDIPPLPQEFREIGQYPSQTLIFQGELDGRTPLESTQTLAKQFTKSHNILVKGAGHDLFMSTPEIINLMILFFTGEEISVSEIKAQKPFSFLKP